MQPEEENKAEEPAVDYGKKRLTFFKSFEEENEYNYRQLALRSYEQRMSNLESLRKRIFYSALLADGNWPPLQRKLTIIILPYEVCL